MEWTQFSSAARNQVSIHEALVSCRTSAQICVALVVGIALATIRVQFELTVAELFDSRTEGKASIAIEQHADGKLENVAASAKIT